MYSLVKYDNETKIELRKFYTLATARAVLVDRAATYQRRGINVEFPHALEFSVPADTDTDDEVIYCVEDSTEEQD